MKCSPEAVSLIHKYLDEDITTNEEKELKQHLQKCKDCQNHFHELKKTIALVKSVNHVEPPDDFTRKVMDKLPKEKRSIGYKRWFKAHPLLTAAAVFLLLMTGSLFSTWTNDQQFSVSKQENIEIQDHTVIVPEGKVVKGDLVVRNGNVKVEGEVQGNVVVINGEKYLASAGNVTGEMEEINAVFDWIWYHIKDFVKEAAALFQDK